MRKVSWDRKGGPLAEFADGYRGDLAGLGFTTNSVVTHCCVVLSLNRVWSMIWMLRWVQMASARSSNAARSLWWLGASVAMS